MKTCRLSKQLGLLAMALTLLVPIAAMADFLTPSTYSKTMNVGETVSLTKRFTVTKGTPTAVPVDIMFMTDSTGSMGSLISTVKANATSIMNDTKALGDVSFAVAQYRDVGDVFVYKLDQNFTTSTATAQTAINTWAASGGGDTPEANLYALYSAVDASWRTGATHILLWFGDAPGHDPSQGGVTVASATAKLLTKNIKVMALNSTSSTSSNLNTYTTDPTLSGQATKITSATGGTYFATVDPDNVVAKIKEAITTSFAKYSRVALDLSAVPSGLTATSSAAQIGSWDRSVDRTFTFSLSFTAKTGGTYNFPVYGTVDFGRTATENDSITVVDQYSKFFFTYNYGGTTKGEYYKGYVYAPTAKYTVGGTLPVASDENGNPGSYIINSVSTPNVDYKPFAGRVYVTDYYNLETKEHFNSAAAPYNLVNYGKPLGYSYLGSEVGYIVSNTNSLYRFGNYNKIFWEADVPRFAKYGFRFDYGNGDYYTGYYYAYFTTYPTSWTRETSAGIYSFTGKNYQIIATADYAKVYIERYYDTHAKKTYTPSTGLISMYDNTYFGTKHLGSECGWLVKAYSFPVYRFFGFGYFEADGI